MKLLIVDDEELTRTGVITSLDWVSLGIDEVLQADDGVHGLETARLYKPEIILCDVRMPRMGWYFHVGASGKNSSGYRSHLHERLLGQRISEGCYQIKSSQLY